MTVLRLRIDKYLEGEIPPQVFAKIYSLEEAAQRSSGRSTLQALIPISHRPEDAKSIQVEAGNYYVEAVLPSGEILADNVSVPSGQTETLVLHGDDSPHEWLSWQHLVGNVQSVIPVREIEKLSKNVRRSARATTAKAGRGTRSAPGKQSNLRKTRSGSSVPRSRTASEPESMATASKLPEVDLARPIVTLSHPYGPLINNEGHLAWAWLANLSSTDPEALLRTLNQNHDPVKVPISAGDSAHAVFRISWSPSSQTAVNSLKNNIAKADRYFAVVPRRQSVELVTLPIPWKVVTTGREADIEIAVQEPTDEQGFCTSAIARDEGFGMLLGYLSSGSLPTAREMVEPAKAMLYEKFENPFAATAGAYALVGTAVQATDREWHGWVHNLMNSFPHIPDGAILWGQLKIRMRRNSADIEDAKQAFKLAYRRGLPFYSLGMRWLMDGLESASRDDAEAEAMLKNVRQLAWRIHYQQPFTIVKLGGQTSV